MPKVTPLGGVTKTATQTPIRNVLQNATSTLTATKNPVIQSSKVSSVAANPSLTTTQGKLQAIAAALNIARQQNALSNQSSPATLAGALSPITQKTANSMGSAMPTYPSYSQLGNPTMNPNMMVAGLTNVLPSGLPVPTDGIAPNNPDWEKYVKVLSPAQQKLAMVMKAAGINIPAGWFSPTSVGLGMDSDWQLKPENQ
jgi:hypothetical protein